MVNVANSIENIVALRHLDGGEVARPLGDRWFYSHGKYICFVCEFCCDNIFLLGEWREGTAILQKVKIFILQMALSPK
jgi:hypothetical protein